MTLALVASLASGMANAASYIGEID
jgi:hypothetical protein